MDITKYMNNDKSARGRGLIDDDDDDDDDKSVSSTRSSSSIFARLRLTKAKSHSDISDDASASSRSSFFRRAKSTKAKDMDVSDDASTSSFFFRKKAEKTEGDKPTKEKRDKKSKKSSKRNKSPKRDKGDESTLEFKVSRSTNPGASLEEVMQAKAKNASKSKDGSDHDVEKKSKRKGKRSTEKDETTSSEHMVKMKSVSDHIQSSPKKKKKDKLSTQSDHTGKKKKKKGSPGKMKKSASSHAKESGGAEKSSTDHDEDDEDDVESLHEEAEEGEADVLRNLANDSFSDPSRLVTRSSVASSSDDDSTDEKGGEEDSESRHEDLEEPPRSEATPRRSIASMGSFSGIVALLRGAPKENETTKPSQNNKTLRFSKDENQALKEENHAGPSSPSKLRESIFKIRTSFSLGAAARRDSVEESTDPKVKKRFTKLWGAENSSNSSLDFAHLENVEEDDGEGGEDEDHEPRSGVPNAETRKKLRQLQTDNGNLRSQLDWALQQLEELNAVQIKMGELQKEHTKALQHNDTLKQELEEREAKIMEKDMQIMNLEEATGGIDDPSDVFYSPYTPGNRKKKLSIDLRETGDEDENFPLEKPRLKKDVSSGAHSWRATARSKSPVPPWRADKSPIRSSGGDRAWRGDDDVVAEKNVEELEEQLEAKDKQMKQMKMELEQLKKEQRDVPHRPLTALVEENKSLRDEVAVLKDQARRQVAAQSASSESVGSDITDDHSSGAAGGDGSDDDEFDETEIKDLHVQLRKDGISSTLAVNRDPEALRRVSMLSCGDNSYMADLQNQLETKEETREDAMIEEAQERYKKILEDKGLPEDEELLCSILEQVVGEWEEEHEKEDRFLAEKLSELKMRLKSSPKEDIVESSADTSDKERKLEAQLSKLKKEIGGRKSFDFRGLVREVNMANDAGDDLAKELNDANEKLKEREKLISELQTTIDEMNSKPTTKEQKSLNKMFEKELGELRSQLNKKDEMIASMHSSIGEHDETNDSSKRIKELEKELQKERDEKKELKIDLTVAKAEIDELREGGSQKSYFSTAKADLRRQDTSGTAQTGNSYFTARSNKSNYGDDDDDDDGPKLNGFMKSYFDKKGSSEKGTIGTTSKSDLLADDDDDDDDDKDKDNERSKMEGVLGQMMKGYFNSSPATSSSPGRPTSDLKREESSSTFLRGYFGGNASESEKEEKDSKSKATDLNQSQSYFNWSRSNAAT